MLSCTDPVRLQLLRHVLHAGRRADRWLFVFPGGWTRSASIPAPDNQPIPHDNAHLNRFIAPLWDDLNQWPGGIYYQVVGTAPNRRVVIEYSRFSRLESVTQPGDTGDFEIILYEGSSAIKLQYKDVDFGNPLYDFGASATVGIQNSPTQGVQYSYNTPSLANELAILFLPPGQSVEHLAYDADVSFQVQVQDVPTINTWITNTAILTNLYGPFHQRSAGTLINTIDLSASSKTIDPATASAGRRGDVHDPARQHRHVHGHRNDHRSATWLV